MRKNLEKGGSKKIGGKTWKKLLNIILTYLNFLNLVGG